MIDIPLVNDRGTEHPRDHRMQLNDFQAASRDGLFTEAEKKRRRPVSPHMLPYHVMQSDKKEIFLETEEKLPKRPAQSCFVQSRADFYFLGTVSGNYLSAAVTEVTEHHQTHK
jgi:hypothetical protein